MADRVIIEVLAGVIPGTPEDDFTKCWTITTTEWEAAGERQMALLAGRAAEAEAYLHILMLQPERIGFARLNWTWR